MGSDSVSSELHLRLETAMNTLLDAEAGGARLVVLALSNPELRTQALWALRVHAKIVTALARELAECP